MAAPVVELWIDAGWVDVSASVLHREGARIRRLAGWRAIDSSVQAATCRFVLANPGSPGPFSHLNPSATYYRKIGIGTLCRVTKDSVVRFYGEIARLQPDAEITGDFAWVEVEARGASGRHSISTRPLESASTSAVLATENRANLLAYWPLEEETKAEATASPIGSPVIDITGDVTFGNTAQAPSTARMISFGATGKLFASVPRYTATGETKVCGLWHIPEEQVPNNSVLIRTHYTGGTVDWIDLRYTTGGTLYNDIYVNNFLAHTTPGSAFSTHVYGTWFFLSFECAQDGSDIDITTLIVGPETTGLIDVDTVTGQTLGKIRAITVAHSVLNGVSFGQLVVGNDTGAFPNWISPTDTGGLGTRAFVGESAAGRIERLAEQKGIASEIRASAANADGMGEQQIKALLECWQDAADADGGMLFDARGSLAVGYIDRDSLFNQLPSLTLDYDAQHFASQLRPADDDTAAVRNDVTVSREGGSDFRAVIDDEDYFHHTTEDPPDGTGPYPASLTMILESDSLCEGQAGWYAHLGSAKDPRFGEVSIRLHASEFTSDADLTEAALAVDIGDVIKVENQPSWCPPDPVELLVYGYEESMDTFHHDITFHVVPAYPWEVWILDGDHTLIAAIDDNDTSLKLATSTGPEWDTTSEPYHISCGGEAMTVTAMATDTPAFIAAGTVAHGDNASVSPGLPAGMTPDVGQILILFAAIRNSGTGTVNQPTGYATISGASDNFRIMAKYYVTGDAAPTVTFTGGVAGATTSARIIGFSGLSRHLDGATSTQLNSSAQNISVPALTTYPSTTGGQRRTNSVVIIGTWKQDDCTDVATPTGFTQAFDSNTTTGDDQSLAAFYRIDTSATDYAAETLTVTGGASAISRAKVFALRCSQTATVTRGVNDVAISHAAAAEVHAWRMGVIA